MKNHLASAGGSKCNKWILQQALPKDIEDLQRNGWRCEWFSQQAADGGQGVRNKSNSTIFKKHIKYTREGAKEVSAMTKAAGGKKRKAR